MLCVPREDDDWRIINGECIYKIKKKILNSNLKIPSPEFIHCLVHYNSTNFNTAVTQSFAIQQEIVIQKKSLDNREIGKPIMILLKGYMVDATLTHIYLEWNIKPWIHCTLIFLYYCYSLLSFGCHQLYMRIRYAELGQWCHT